MPTQIYDRENTHPSRKLGTCKGCGGTLWQDLEKQPAKCDPCRAKPEPKPEPVHEAPKDKAKEEPKAKEEEEHGKGKT